MRLFVKPTYLAVSIGRSKRGHDSSTAFLTIKVSSPPGVVTNPIATRIMLQGTSWVLISKPAA